MFYLRMGAALVLVYFLVQFSAVDFTPLKAISVLQWPILLVFPLCAHILQSQQFRYALRMVSVPTSFVFGLLLVTSNTFLNLVAPLQAGTISRAVYLKKTLGVEYFRYTSVLVISQLASWSVGGLLLTLMLLFSENLARQLLEMANFTALIFLVLALLGVAAAWYFLKEKYAEMAGVIKSMLSGGSGLRVGSFWVLGVYRAAVNLLSALSLFLIGSTLGFEFDFSLLFLITLLTSMSVFIVVTPGNIGIVEGVMFLFATILGMDAQAVLVVVLVDRILFYLLAASGALAGLIVLPGHLAEK